MVILRNRLTVYALLVPRLIPPVKEWETETKRTWILALAVSAWFLSWNGMVDPFDTWTIEDFLLYPFAVVIVGVALFWPLVVLLSLLEMLLDWVSGKK